MASAPAAGRAYSHPGYAESLSEFGVPRSLPRCGGWLLERAFPDRMQPLKSHFIRDLHQPVDLPRNHRRNIRRAFSSLKVEVCADPLWYLDEWMRLYAGLVGATTSSGSGRSRGSPFAASSRYPA